ncbi:MAG: TerB family tellurite resistance protein [Bacteroidota bacterium]|nr:TerB family tellurite resistance protein [Bacteroidota bacterium]
MGSFGKWIGGGLGWALGGPIGALIGFTLGSMFDGTQISATTTTLGPHRTTEGDFKMSLLVLMACIMKADGHVDKSELAVVKRFLVANFGEQGALDALQILKNLLEQDIDEREVAMQISQNLNYSSKLELLHLLFSIANADGEVDASELITIQRIANIFNIDRLDFESVKAPYMKQVDRDWAFKSLEIEPTASNEEIKKAYRTMAKKYHPDKVNDLGEDVKKSATEKFRSVNEAYESLKKQRGFA